MIGKPLWIGMILSVAIALSLTLAAYREVPKLKTWTRFQLEKVSQEQLPVHLSAGEIELNFFPLGLTLRKVQVSRLSGDIGIEFDPFEIASVRLQLSLFNLVQGRLRLHKVTLQGAKIILHILTPKKKSGKPLDGLFRNLGRVPLRELEIDNLSAVFKTDSPKVSGELDNINLVAENQFLNLGIRFSASGLKLKDETSSASVILQIDSQFLLKPYDVTVGALKIHRGESYVVASGNLKGDTEALRFDSYDLKGRSYLDLEPTRDWIVQSVPAYSHLPQLKGTANFEADFKKEKTKSPHWAFELSTEKMQVDQFFVDRLKTKGIFQNNRVEFSEAQLLNPGGELNLKQTVVTLTPSAAVGSFAPSAASVTTQLQVNKGQLHEVFQSLGLKNIALWLEMSGELPCQGTLRPDFDIECTGSMRGENLILKSDHHSKKSIVEIDTFNAKGNVHITNQAISYLTDLEMPKSKGVSQGVIDFEKGFKIDFEGDPLAIADIRQFAGLKLEGALNIKGTTQGNSHTATFNADVKGTDLWLDDFWLGSEVKTSLAYTDGNLSFAELRGFYTSSRYAGNLVLDLRKNLINLNGQVPFFEAKDLLQIFSRKVRLPFEITGTGKAQVSVSGPLEFTRLTYDLKSSMFRGSVYREAFDQADFNIHAVNGEVSTDRVVAQRGNSTIALSGEGHPDGLIDTTVLGHNIHLEDSVNLKTLGMNLAGQFDFAMKMKGPVLSPDADLQGKISKTAIGDQSIDDSVLHLKLGSSKIDGDGVFLGHAILGKFTIPLKPDAPFLLDAETDKWNFTPIFASMAAGMGRKDFETQLTSKIHLTAPQGGFWQSTGKVSVSSFSIKRGSLSMSAPRELQITMQNGQLRFPDFYIEGDNTFLKISDVPHAGSAEKVNAQVNGRLDMSVLGLLLPFFEDLRGTLSFAFNAKGDPTNLNFIGSAYVEKGFLKLFDFPHPFEDFKADILFNEKKILVNSLRGSFASGRFSGDGLLEMKGYKNLPLNFNIRLDHVSLNVPDQVKTLGSGDLTFSGNWFPFHMEGTYDIVGGEISKEFAGGSDKGSVKRSYFLPDFLLQENFQPLTMNLKVNFDKGLPVKNSIMHGRVFGELKIGGTPSAPTITGSVTAEKDAKVYFNETEFQVISGTFDFADPSDINPALYMSAISRVQEYDVTLILSGTAKNPKIVLSSQPPLSQPDIVSLLALGSTTNSRLPSVQQGSTASFSVGSAILKQNPIGRELKDRFGIDMQFTSSVDDTDSVALQKIAITGEINKSLSWDYNRAVGQQSADEAHLRYHLTKRVSVVGSYEDQEYSEIANTDQISIQNKNVFGLDLEYRFEFK